MPLCICVCCAYIVRSLLMAPWMAGMKSLVFGGEDLADSSIEFWWTPSAYYQQPMSFSVKGKAGYQKLSQAVVGMGAWYIHCHTACSPLALQSLLYLSLSLSHLLTLPLSQGCRDLLQRSGSLAYDNEAQSRTAHSSWCAAGRQRNPQVLAGPLYRCLDILLCCCHRSSPAHSCCMQTQVRRACSVTTLAKKSCFERCSRK